LIVAIVGAILILNVKSDSEQSSSTKEGQ
jgi:hypothetical protein